MVEAKTTRYGDALVLRFGQEETNNSYTLGFSLRADLPQQPASREVSVRFSRQEVESLETYHSRIDQAVFNGNFDLTTDYDAHLAQLDTVVFIEALKQAQEGITLVRSNETEMELKLGLYYKKALIQKALASDDVSYPVLTINEALKKFDATSSETQREYKKSLIALKEKLIASLDTQKTIDLADKLASGANYKEAIDLLEHILLIDKDQVADSGLTLDLYLATANKLISLLISSGFFSRAIEAGVYTVDALIDNLDDNFQDIGDLSQAETNPELEKFAQAMLLLYGKRSSDKSLELIAKLREKFPNNKVLKGHEEKLNTIETLYAQVIRANEDGDYEKAYAAILEKEGLLKAEVVKNNLLAITLWLEKIDYEYDQLHLDAFVQSIKESLDLLGQLPPLAESDSSLMPAFIKLAEGDCGESKAIAKKFLKGTDNLRDGNKPEREKAHWLVLKSLAGMKLPIGQNIINLIKEEFPGSTLLAPFISA